LGQEVAVSEEGKGKKLWATWKCLIAGPAGRMGLGLAGRSMAILAGCCSMTMGVILTLTLCGAVVGLPLFAFGFLLVARGLF
jgi:ABC-type multidrug transport system permease subunit